MGKGLSLFNIIFGMIVQKVRLDTGLSPSVCAYLCEFSQEMAA